MGEDAPGRPDAGADHQAGAGDDRRGRPQPGEDIHIEPMKDRVRVRYRIDGECVERDRIPLRMKGPLICRV